MSATKESKETYHMAKETYYTGERDLLTQAYLLDLGALAGG